MGYLRVSWLPSVLTIFVGKGLRYYAVVLLVSLY